QSMPQKQTSTSPLSPSVKRVSFSGGVAPSAPLQVCSVVRSRTRKLSSLPRRTRPTSDLAYNSTIIRRACIKYRELLRLRTRQIVTLKSNLFQCLIQIGNDV